MSRNLLAIVSTGCMAIFISGCQYIGPASVNPAGSQPGLITLDQIYPAMNSTNTVYQLDTDDFEIRGTVEASGEASTMLFGLYSEGDNGYGLLMEELRDQGADDVINLRADVTYSNFLFLITNVKTTLTGTAIKYKY